MTPPRIGFLLPRYSAKSRSYMPRVVAAAADLGAQVEVIHPAAQVLPLRELRVVHDLYVLRKTSGYAMSLAAALHELGATIINPYPVTAALTDKIVATRILHSAGVPVPDTFVATHPGELAPLLATGPLVLKPYRGGGGHGVRVVRTVPELEQGSYERYEPVFAQRYLPHDGRDRKIYAIGGRLFGVKKVFPRPTEEAKQGEPFALTPALEEIARRVGAAFGLDLYGVDIIESDGRPWVVDVCSIPGFKGVPDAPRLLARYLVRAACRAVRSRGRSTRGALMLR